MFKHKKAVSALVATVLLILITVAAVGIIWGAIMPMITTSLNVGRECLNARLTVNTQSGYTCIISTANQTQVMISRGSEEFTPAGMQILASGQGRTITISLNSTPNAFVRMIDGIYGGALQIPNINEERTYVINTSGIAGNVNFVPTDVAVAPVALVGRTQRVCDATSTAPLIVCS